MKKILFTLIILLSCTFLQAKTVNIEDAKLVARNFYTAQVEDENIEPYIEVIELQDESQTIIYAFNFDCGGFVLVAADDVSRPVLGYSLHGTFDLEKASPSCKFLIERYKRSIHESIKNDHKPIEKAKKEWKNLLRNSQYFNNKDLRAAGPFLITIWGQRWPYNAYCPADTNVGDDYNDHVPVGCVAVAMSQVMNYWEHPWHGEGSSGYTHSNYGYQSADYGNTIYNYDNMPNEMETTDYSHDVATLMYHCAVSVEMDFGPGGSGAWGWGNDDVSTALEDYFYYSNDAEEELQSSHAATWDDMMKDELDAGRPIVYGARDIQNDAGHAWVIDGYGGDWFHMNWGWCGNHDGYYLLDEPSPGGYSFDDYDHACIGIHPKCSHLDGTWTLDNSPYIINYDQFVDAGDVLTIEPGVEVNFTGRYRLVVNGTLLAQATSTDSIVFHADTLIGWKGIRIYNTNDTEQDTTKISHCLLTNGKAKGDYPLDLSETFGGALCCWNSSSVVVEHSRFSGNYSDQSGGAICLMDTSDIIIRNSIIQNNTAETQGGGVDATKSSPFLDNVTIKGNNSGTSGGGIWAECSNITIENSIIENNDAHFGAGIIMRGNAVYGIFNPHLNNVVIRNNEATVDGGGLECYWDLNLTMDSVNVYNNIALIDGGGVYLSSCDANITNSKIYNNQAIGGKGGGVYCGTDGEPYFYSTLIYNNTASTHGGGIYCEETNYFEVEKVTIAENYITLYEPDNSGEAISLNNARMLFLNTVVWDESPIEDVIHLENGSIIEATYSLLQNGTGESWFGTGCVDADPLFADISSNDFTPTWSGYPLPDMNKSPCIDAGSTLSPGDPDGTTPDIGALYYHQTYTTLSGGNISGTLLLAESPYFVDGDLVVPSGSELIIEPGVSIIFTDHYKFEVNGILLAQGNESSFVNIAAQDTTIGFKGLRIKNTNPSKQDSCKIEYCRITYGNATGYYEVCKGGGIYISNSSNVLIKNCLINKNRSDCKGGGVHFAQFGKPVFINNTIRNNHSHAGGGVSFDYTNSDLILKNCIIEHNTANYGGGLYYLSCSPQLSGVTVRHNYAEIHGGGMYFYSIPNVEFDTMDRCDIYCNKAKVEGMDFFADVAPHITINVVVDTFTVLQPAEYFAFPFYHYSFDILQGKIQQASADLYISETGSDDNTGLHAGDPMKTIENALLKINPEGRTQLSIHIANGTYSYSTTGEEFPINCRDNVSFIGENTEYTILDGENTSQLFYCYYDSTFSIQNMTIKNGYTADDGGAIYMTYSNPQLMHVDFKDNNADGNGGAICCYTNSNPHFEDVTITNNNCIYYGGGMDSYQSDFTMNDCSITGGSSAKGGGVSLRHNSEAIMDSVNIAYNDAISQGGYLGEGGGLYISSSDPYITNAIIYDNEADYYGGGINYDGTSYGVMKNVDILDNESNIRGGGIYSYGANYTKFYNVNIFYNSSNNGAGLYSRNDSDIKFYNTIISNNSTDSYDGAGAYIKYSNVEFNNATIAYNNAARDGGGMYLYNTDMVFTNSILWADTPNEIDINSGFSGTITCTYSDVADGTGQSWFGTGCIDGDPQFINPAGWIYSLEGTSPCINAGTPDTSGLNIPSYDFAGNQRIVGDTIDMGAYEYQETILGIPTNVTINIVNDSVNIQWNAVSGASSYKIYSSDDPYTGFTEIASGISGTDYSVPITESKKFYYVKASTDTKAYNIKKNKRKSSQIYNN